MAWCPKCKYEFVEGIVECPDCKVPLVETLEELPVALIEGMEEILDDLNQFLAANGIASGYTEFNEKAENFQLFVAAKDESESKKMLSVYLKENQKKFKAMELGCTEEELEEYEKSAPSGRQNELFEKTVPYVEKSARSEEYKSSAYTLLIVGIAGICLILLQMAGVIHLPLNGTTKFFVYTVMGAMFLFFVIFGFFSLRTSRRIALGADEEKAYILKVEEMIRNTLPRELLEESVLLEDTEEEKYFKRMEQIKNIITTQYPEIEEALLEKIAEEYYCELYGEE